MINTCGSCGVVPNDKPKTDVLVNEGRNIVADVEDEPDGDEAGNAVEVNLQEIPNNVSIEESHCDLPIFDRNLRITIALPHRHFPDGSPAF